MHLLSSVSKKAASLGLSAAATTLNSLGSIACVAGGVGVSLATVCINTTKFDVYMQGSVAANIGYNITNEMLTNTIAHSSPVNYSNSQIEHIFVPSEALYSPEMMAWTASFIAASGTALRLIAGNIQLFIEHQSDKDHYQEKQVEVINRPTFKEISLKNCANLTHSLSLTFCSAALVGLVAEYSGALNEQWNGHYPQSSEQTVNEEAFSGPVMTKSADFNYTKQYTESLSLKDIPVQTTARIHTFFKGVANAKLAAKAQISTCGGSKYFYQAMLAGAMLTSQIELKCEEASKRERDNRIDETLVHDHNPTP